MLNLKYIQVQVYRALECHKINTLQHAIIKKHMTIEEKFAFLQTTETTLANQLIYD